jgi:hypothetical protein
VGRRLFVFVASCTECSNWLPPALKAVEPGPVILLTATKRDYIPRQYLKDPTRLLVVCDPEAKILSAKIYNDSPQVYVLSPGGEVSACPRPGEEPLEFIGRLSKS